MPNADTVLTWKDVENLVETVTAAIAKGGWQPDVIVALSRGGFVPATMLAYRLGVKKLVGLDARKNANGPRSTGHLVALKGLDGQKVLVVDDSILTGHLLTVVPQEVRQKGGEPKTCALISLGQCPDPDYFAEKRAELPDFPWE